MPAQHEPNVRPQRPPVGQTHSNTDPTVVDLPTVDFLDPNRVDSWYDRSFPAMNPSASPTTLGVGSLGQASESSEWLEDDTSPPPLREMAFFRDLVREQISGSQGPPVSAAAAGLLSIPGLAARRPSPDMDDSDEESAFSFEHMVRETYRGDGGRGRRGNTNSALEAQAPPSVANFLAHHTKLVPTHALREDETTCVICLVKFGETEPESPSPSIPEYPLKIQLPYCKHIFGNKCLYTQILGGSAPDERHCPVCKGPFWRAAPSPYDHYRNGGLGSRTPQSSRRSTYDTGVPVHYYRQTRDLIAEHRESDRRQPESQDPRSSLVPRTVGDPPIPRPSANNDSGPSPRNAIGDFDAYTSQRNDLVNFLIAREAEVSNRAGSPADHPLGVHPAHRNRSNTRSNTRSEASTSAREQGQSRNTIGLLRPATARSRGEQILLDYVDHHTRQEEEDGDSTYPTIGFRTMTGR